MRAKLEYPRREKCRQGTCSVAPGRARSRNPTRTILARAITASLLLAGCSENGPSEPPASRPKLDPLPESAAIAFVSTRDGNEAVYVANADGSGVVRIGSGTSPAWAPDGRRLAFVEVLGERAYQITIIEEDGSRRILVGGGFHPSWSPDGTRIVYACSCGRDHRLRS